MNRPFTFFPAGRATFCRPPVCRALLLARAHTKDTPMTDKFDPAPHDKHAADLRTAGTTAHTELDAALAGSFPASDPVSAVQPAPSKEQESFEGASLWHRITRMFG
jgi:hypothetical protein